MDSMRGVTLVELLVTISIAVVLLTLAVPSIIEMTRQNRVVGAGNELAAAFNLARSEAVKRSATVTICPDGNGDNTCDDVADWTETSLIILANAAVLRRVPAVSGVDIASSVNAFAYDSRGAATLGTVTLGAGACPKRTQRQIAVAATGRIQTSTVDCP